MRHNQIQPGTYVGTVTGSALGRAGNGTEQIVISFDVHLEDPETGAPCSLPMTWYGFFSEKALATTDKALAALGFDATARDISELNPDEPHQSPIVGAEADLVVEYEGAQDGGQRLRIRWVNRRGGGLAVKERLDPTAARAFGADLRKRLVAQRGPGAAKVAPATRPASAAPPARPPAATSRPAAAAPARQASSAGEALRTAAPPQRFDEETVARAKAADVNFDDIPF